MSSSKKVFIVLIVLLGILVLIPSLLIFKFRSVIVPFFTLQNQTANILILGKGGLGHEAPDLTDTMILASVSNQKINLVSLPRDIWVPEIRAKLNSAYYWGKQKNEGFRLVDDSVEKITGVKVDYNLVIDFSVFKNLIDSLGGVEVNVQNSFTDAKYPIEGKENDLCGGDATFSCRYETITFEKGNQVMDGEKALKFVRSRNAIGDEGTDFAREARQQLLISAIKNKVLSPEVILNPIKIKSVWSIFMSSIETDISRESLGKIAKSAFDARNNISSNVIPENFLVHPPISTKYDKQYVLIPRTGDWNQVQKWISDLQK